jgi:predicted patatin/cPLA2 family phospholipase
LEENKTFLEKLQSTADEEEKSLDGIIEQQFKLEKQALEEQIELFMISETSERYNEELMNVQHLFNAVVDPFNEIRQITFDNKQNYQRTMKQLEDIEKDIENIERDYQQKGGKFKICNKESMILTLFMLQLTI